MTFGQKLRKIRKEKGFSQERLAERLGYSYITDVERGEFIPSEEKLKKIAKALGISFSQIKDILIESKLEDLGIKEKALQELFRDIPKLPENAKRKIIEVYLKTKERLKQEDIELTLRLSFDNTKIKKGSY